MEHAPGGAARSHNVILINDRGTPVWWRRAPDIPFNSTLLPDGALAWGRWYEMPFGFESKGAWDVHRLDGSLVRTLRTVGTPTDMHDMQPLPNGNHLLVSCRFRDHVDLRPYGGHLDGAVWDGEIQEVDQAGVVVWAWNTKDHIPLSETRHWDLGRHPVLGKDVYDVSTSTRSSPTARGS